MFRTPATRSLLRSLTKAPTARSGYSAASSQFRHALRLRQLSNKRPQVLAGLARPQTTTLSYATKSEPGSGISPLELEAEKKLAQEIIDSDPDHVSADSSVRHVFEESQAPKEEAAADMSAGLKADLVTIKETFSMSEVPKESLYLGAAGVIPYAATSLSTVYLAFDINQAHETGSGYLFSPELARQLLDIVTPIQIGYGAVIISFLGAIHWGMEYSGFGGYHSYRRYAIGVVAPAVAWPTIFMPVEYALITQFVAFNFLYFTDARATTRGWFPAWYSIYRFVLTFFVGASIVVSLIGRGRIVAAEHAAMIASSEHIKADRDVQWAALEREENERRKALAAEEEEEEGDSEDGDGEKKDDESDDESDKKDDKEEK
ncbi:related to MNN4-regulates the mannosylphosphorylation [Rhynchosporium secalis]|uniref:Related to MNN4-regulates the mannosylphosphorylation n=1 Tax=Rhynchosporium secalis TaxID=38038 RepID=A0A1E1MU59_RHYSE|nr:related to MNN4-regulates the mannosylphosphorylation [Rhynchosporium secalis]